MPTAKDMLDLTAKDVGKPGDNYVWNGLADEVPDDSLHRWADWDSPYCQGGLQLAFVRIGMGLVKCALPYFVPSLEKYARNKGRWVAFKDIRPGDWICFDWGGDGIADHVALATDVPRGSSVRTLEYNTSKTSSGSQSNGRGCWRRTRYSSQIRGAYRPPYTAHSQHGYTVEHWRKSQKALIDLGYDVGTADGVNGPKTEKGTKRFQKARGMREVDGIPGPDTWTEIKAARAEAAKPKPKPKPEPEPLPKPAVEPKPERERISGTDRWDTAAAVEQWTMPDGPGLVIAADGSPDWDYAVAKTATRVDVRLLPVRRGSDEVPTEIVSLAKSLTPQPRWFVSVGGPNAVTNLAQHVLAEAVGL